MYVHMMGTELPPMLYHYYMSLSVSCDQYTALPLVGVLVTYDTDIFIILSIISVKNEKLLNSNNNRSKPKLLRLLWDSVVFRLVAYLLNIIYLNLLFIYKILYI